MPIPDITPPDDGDPVIPQETPGEDPTRIETEQAEKPPETIKIPLSRKEAAQKRATEMDTRLSALQTELTEAKAWKEELTKEREGRIKLEAQIEEIRRYQEQARQPPQGQAPDTQAQLREIDSQMRDALDRGDWNRFTELRHREQDLRMEVTLEKFKGGLSPQPQRQLPVPYAAVQYQHQQVWTHPQGEQAIKTFYDLMVNSGKPATPATFEEAHKKAEEFLGMRSPQTQQPSERTRQSLSAPSPANAGGKQAKSYIEARVPERIKDAAREMERSGMFKYDEYINSWLEDHPEAVVE
jgi:hypothetical protein